MAHTLAFLQARVGSTRLPGKVLLLIQGKSILQRAVERLRASPGLDEVVVLTTCLPEDDAVVEEAHAVGVEVFRGPHADVLARYRMAADLFKPDIIVRATADNPLVDIGTSGRIVRHLKSGGFDYCIETELPVGAATEAITRTALERVDTLGRLPHHREHVTVYVKEHRQEFQTSFPRAPGVLRFPNLRLTVDTPEDFAFVSGVIRSVPELSSPIPLEKYLERLTVNLVQA